MKNKKMWIIIFAGIILFVVFAVYNKEYFFPYYKIEDKTSLIEKSKKEMTETVIGWIKVQGTDIDYPIIDSNTKSSNVDDFEYAWMNYSTDKIENRMAIFGHNIQNVSSLPLIRYPKHTRFEQLLGFVYKDYAEENQYIQLTIGEKEYLYRIYAVYFIEEVDKGLNMSREELKEYSKKAKENSYYDYDVDVSEKDPLITLLTCTRFFGPTTDYEFKVEGRLVRQFEKVDKKKITETEKYKEIKDTLEEGEKNAEA